MDDLDRAKELEMADRDRALANTLASALPTEEPEYNDSGRRICLDCGVVIPIRRLKAYPHAVRCVDCKQVIENRKRHYR